LARSARSSSRCRHADIQFSAAARADSVRRRTSARRRASSWGPLAKALRYEWDSSQKVATGKRAVTPALALRVARFVGIAMDELLAGQWLSTRVCPHCGHPPEDFVDEETVVESGGVKKR
jgi:hypothetical protein